MFFWIGLCAAVIGIGNENLAWFVAGMACLWLHEIQQSE